MAANLVPSFIIDFYRAGQRRGAFWTAALFVDISGFTSLTESLMRHHKGGVEALTEAVEEIFNPLIDEVYRRGGVIPLFAGDAFTALFPIYGEAAAEAVTRNGAEVVRQAVEAAFLVQQRLAAEGGGKVYRTRYGDFEIGAKVGLSCGRAEWGIVERDGRGSFYVRGTAVEGCAYAQQAAGRGEVVAEAALLPYLPGGVAAGPVAGTGYYRLVAERGAGSEERGAGSGERGVWSVERGAGGVEGGRREEVVLSEEEVGVFVHPTVRGLATRAEFRDVCPIFISFEGEEVAGFVAAVMGLVEQYGGYFSQVDFSDKGGIVLVLFGAPLAHENNLERAAGFLLALRGAQVGLKWRVGLTSGTVWAGLRGNEYRSEYSVIGDVVNLAARLASGAGWGEIWLAQAAYQGLRHSYEMEPAGTFRFKGKQGETMVYRLGSRKTAEELVYTTGLVGREEEVAALQEGLRPILAGRFAGVMMVYGEAGVGKSRLVYEVRKRPLAEGGAAVQWMTCPAEAILRQSLHPFRYFLRGYFGQSGEQTAAGNRAAFDEGLDRLLASLPAGQAGLGEELRRTRSFLAALVDIRWEGSLYERVEPKLRFENTLAAMVALVRAESWRRPVVLHVEDAHWLDGDSRQLVGVLAQQLAAFPVAILLTERHEEGGIGVELGADVPQRVIDLNSLSAVGTRALAEQVLAGAVNEEVAAFLVAKTMGNPFFVEQLVLDLRERGMIRRPAAGEWQIAGREIAEVPTGINSVLVARLDRLPAQVKAVVQAAAVLGQEFEVRVLFHMLKEDQQLPVKVRQAEQDAIWSAMGEVYYLFKHALLRDAAYQMQLRSRLRELHALAAAAIEQVYGKEVRVADLAYHYGRAEMVEKERQYARLAGEEAAGRFANREAVEYLSRALLLAGEEDVAGRSDLLRRREEVYDRMGEREAQRQDIEALLALAEEMNEDGRRAEAALRWANYLDAMGDFPATFRAGVAVAALGRRVGLVQYAAAGMMLQGRAMLRQSDFAAAVGCLEEAIALAHAGDLPDIEANSLSNLGVVAMYQGNYEGARARIEQALAIHRQKQNRHGESAALGNLGVIASRQGDYEAARGYYAQALAVFQEIGDRRGESIALANLGDIGLRQGDFAAADNYLHQALRLYQEIGDRFGASIVLGNLGDLQQRRGRYDEAGEYYQQTLAICRQIGDRGGESWALGCLALLWADLGEVGAAERDGRLAVAIAQEVGARSEEAAGWMSLGHGRLAGGRLEEAMAAFEQAWAIQEELGEQKQGLRTQAGMALTWLAGGNLQRAVEQVEMIWGHLAAKRLDWLDNPQKVYLACYRVWQASGDGRAAVMGEWAAAGVIEPDG